MKKETIIEIISNYVKSECDNGKTINNWWHTWRIYQESLKINEYENGNIFVISMISLLHGLFDNDSNSNIDVNNKIITLLEEKGIKKYISDIDINNIVNSVSNMFYIKTHKELSNEGKIVQDAHIIDELGLSAIHRFFNGAKINKSTYYLDNETISTDIELKHINLVAETEKDVVDYLKKIIKLEKFVNTDYAKFEIEKGHKLMLDYLVAIYDKDYSKLL